eukprot:m.49438 g.49438  ORF g.49438 m.49438 type:complete len:1557 (+) comp33985_c0_seq2:406-5076(+)
MLLRARRSSQEVGKVVAVEKDLKRKRRKSRSSDVSRDPESLADDVVKEGRKSEAGRASEKKRRRKSHDPATAAEEEKFDALFGILLDKEEFQDGIDLTVEEVSSDVLLPHSEVPTILAQLKNLRSSNHLRKVSFNKLVQLIRILSLQVIDAKCLSLPEAPDQSESSEPQQWRQLVFDRILHGTAASLSILCIMTTPKMSQKVVMEEAIDVIVSFSAYQLKHNVYPEYDALCAAVVGKKKEGAVDFKRRSKGKPVGREVALLCSQLMEIVTQLSELIERQKMSSFSVIQITSLGIQSFFVENMGALQLRSLKVVRSTFSRYESQREEILQEILESLTKLPTSKRNIRNFQLPESPGESIQMMTALVLQLVQSSISVPKLDVKRRRLTRTDEERSIDDIDVASIMTDSFAKTKQTIRNFLRSFVNKCGSKTDDTDYRPLLEHFVADLLLLINHPQWPAADVLLHTLSNIMGHLVSGGKSVEIGLKTTAIEHLGTIASALKMATVSRISRYQEVVMRILEENEMASGGGSSDELSEAQIQCLQRQLLQFLSHCSCSDSSYLFAGRFLLAHWMKDNQTGVDRVLRDQDTLEGDDGGHLESSHTSEVLDVASQRKDFLEGLTELTKVSAQGTGFNSKLLSHEEASALVCCFANRRYWERLFDYCLAKILHACNEATVAALRSKSLKSLSAILSADASILKRADVQYSVHLNLKDQAIKVREAALEIIGKYVLACPNLLSHYYAMLNERLQKDSGISVRKRVVKILRDICVSHPSCPKIPEMCVSMVKRINDEPSMKELVSKVFHQLWFSNLGSGENPDESTAFRVQAILDTVFASPNRDCGWLEQLLQSLLKADAESQSKSVLESCRRIIDHVVQLVPKWEKETSNLLTCITTLQLFAKCVPSLLVKHATLFQPLLSLNCEGDVEQADVVRRCALTLDLIVPMMENPSQVFLAALEESLVRVMFNKRGVVVASGTKCLDTVVNKITKNYKIVQAFFNRFYDCLVKAQPSVDNGTKLDASAKSSVLRSVYTVGLLCNHFDLNHFEPVNGRKLTPSFLMSVMSSFAACKDSAIQVKAFAGLGLLCRRYPELHSDLEEVYVTALQSKGNAELKQKVLENLKDFFIEHGHGCDSVEKSDATVKEKIINKADSKSGQCSSLAEKFGPLIRSAIFSPVNSVRRMAAETIFAILSRGLIHPLEFVSYLVAVSTDPNPEVKSLAEQHLSQIDSKYPRFIQTQSFAGIARSFTYQRVLASDRGAAVRGLLKGVDCYKAQCSHLYSLLRDNRQQRRSFLGSLVRSFLSAKKEDFGRVLFFADSLASFSYCLLDEPLFVVQQLDKTATLIGTQSLGEYREAFTLLLARNGTSLRDIDDLDTVDDLAAIFPELDAKALMSAVVSGHCCLLLFLVKAHIMRSYGLSESKCREYLASEKAKMYDKPVTRKLEAPFNAPAAVALVKELGDQAREGLHRMEVFHHYLELKRSMFRLTAVSDDEDDGNQVVAAAAAEVEEPSLVKKKTPTKSKRRSSLSGGGGANPSAGIKRRRSSATTSGKSGKKRRRTNEDIDYEA